MTTTLDGSTGPVDDLAHPEPGALPANTVENALTDPALAVEIVLPVYNEEIDLEPSVRRLATYLDSHFPFSALAGLHAAVAEPARTAELAVLISANLVATVLRFLAYRVWLCAPRRHGANQQPGSATADV